MNLGQAPLRRRLRCRLGLLDRVLVGQIRMRLFNAGVQSGLDRAPRLRLAIVGDQAAGRGRIEQRGLDLRARNPAGAHHRADAERFLVKDIVTVAGRGVGQLLGATVERGLRIGALAGRRFLGAGIAGRTAGAIRFFGSDFLPAMAAHDLGGARNEGSGGLGGYQRQILAPQLRPGLTTMPAIRLARIRMNAIDDDLLAIAEHFDFVHQAVRRFELRRYLLEWRIGPERNSALRRQADAHGAALDLALEQRLDLFGHFFDRNIDVDKRRIEAKHAGVQMVSAGNRPRLDNGIGRADVDPIIKLRPFAVHRHQPIAGREQLLAIKRNAIQRRPGRLMLRQFLEMRRR